MKKILIRLINFYQKFISFDTGIFSLKKGTTCVFYPTCSEYTKEAILKYGASRGVFAGFKRILRCHPWQKEHIDPVL